MKILGKRVLVYATQKEKTNGGILIPKSNMSASMTEPQNNICEIEYVVKDVGAGVKSVKEGDSVEFNKYNMIVIKDGGIVINEEDILLIY